MAHIMRYTIGSRPLGIWIALGCMLFSLLMGGGGQTLSVIDWDRAMALGLQENDLNDPDIVERVLTHVEWGVAAGDVVVTVPLLILGLVGVACRRRWGMIAALMAAATWIHMFFVYTLQRCSLTFRGGLTEWEHYAGIIVVFAMFGLGPCLLTTLGLAANADSFAPARPHSHRLRRREDALAPSRLEDMLICAGQVLRAFPLTWIAKRLTWNASRAEVERKLAGDGMAEGALSVNRAITIECPPEEVWPWVARFGRGAGYYSWDFLDNPGHRHADYIVDGPEPAIGDWNKDLGTIRHLEPGRELVWFDETDFLGFPTPFPMTFRLDPVGERATRLHFRMSLVIPQDTFKGRIALRIVLLMDHVMSAEMLSRLKLLIETYDERLRTGETNRALAPHQKCEWRPAGAEQEGS